MFYKLSNDVVLYIDMLGTNRGLVFGQKYGALIVALNSHWQLYLNSKEIKDLLDVHHFGRNFCDGVVFPLTQTEACDLLLP